MKAQEKRGVRMDAVVQKKKEKGTYPEDFFHPKGDLSEGDNNGHYVMDKRGTVWMVVRDGGMVQTCDYSGRVFSAGIAWLEKHHGPLVTIDGSAHRVLYIEQQRRGKGTKKAHPNCMIDRPSTPKD